MGQLPNLRELMQELCTILLYLDMDHGWMLVYIRTLARSFCLAKDLSRYLLV